MIGDIHQLNPEEYFRVRDFADRMKIKEEERSSRNYQRNDNRKAHEREMVGKVGEIGAVRIFGGKADFGIHSGYSYQEPDLTEDLEHPFFGVFKNMRLHIKTANIGLYDSWLVGKTDPIYSDPSTLDIIVLMLANANGKWQCAGYVIADQVGHLWKPSIRIPHKLALYLDDLGDQLHTIVG